MKQKRATRIDILLKAMPDPEPANTKISVEMNSAKAALSESGWLASPGVPTAILLIGISLNLSLVSTFVQALYLF